MQDEAVFENDILGCVQELLIQYAAVLEDANLKPVIQDFRKEGRGTEKYTSELAICFYDGNRFFDVIEFFIYEHGKPVASKEETRAWLVDALEDLLRRRKRLIRDTTH